MSGLIAIGAGIAVLVGIGAGIGIGIATGKAVSKIVTGLSNFSVCAPNLFI